MGWIVNKLMGVSPDKAVDHIASGIGAIGTMIDERKFTDEEKSKADMKMVEKGIEFHAMQVEQNSERSKARRDIAEKWIHFYLERLLPGYLLLSLVNVFDQRFASLVVILRDVVTLMSTGTLMIIGFFFGTHALRAGIKIAKGK